MYNVAVCEDKQKEQKEIVLMIKEILQKNQIDSTISCYQSGEELLHVIQNGTRFHLLLIDVLLEEIDGIELAKQLRSLHNTMEIVFISWNKEMALKGYEVAAARYLTKPIQKNLLQEALLFCYRKQMEKEILLPTRNGWHKICLSDIMYAEAQGRSILLILVNEQLEVQLKISEVEDLLSNGSFMLCHRSYLVNLTFVQYIRCYEIELKNGKILPVSKYRFSEIKKKLFNYLPE